MPTLEITTVVGCPLNCSFCPQDKLLANYPVPTVLTSDDSVRALSVTNLARMLLSVPKHVRIDFSGLSEPWANRQATAMLRYVLKEGYNTAIYTTLQGMRDPDAVCALIETYSAQIETIVVHLPDIMGNMRGWKDSPAYQNAFSAFQNLELIVPVQFMTMGHDTLVARGSTLDWSPLSRAGNLDLQSIGEQSIEKTPTHTGPLMCSFTPFYDHSVLLPNGDVVLCCMDYSLKHKLGNLLREDYYDLFMSGELAALRRENMQYVQETRQIDRSLCRSCSRAKRLHTTEQSAQFWEEVCER